MLKCEVSKVEKQKNKGTKAQRTEELVRKDSYQL